MGGNFIGFPIERNTYLGLQNLSIAIFEQNMTRRSPDFEAQYSRKGRSGFQVTAVENH